MKSTNKNRKLLYFGTNIDPQLGDVVKYFGDDSNMVVEDIIDSSEKRKEWGVEENGIMLKSKKYGLVFEQLGENSDVEFIARKNTNDNKK